jgi:hypothetical protein
MPSLDRKEYTEWLRGETLERLDNLRKKVSSNERTPYGEQDMEMLTEIVHKLDECLKNWYFESDEELR